MIKNKWRLAFWFCLATLIVVSVFALYSMLDQGVTITYMKDGYEKTENDLNSLIDLINSQDLSKTAINKSLHDHNYYEFMDFNSDTIGLERVDLIFKNDSLFKIEKYW